VTATVGEQRGWRTAQARLARLSTDSVHETVAGATHAALLEDARFAAAIATSSRFATVVLLCAAAQPAERRRTSLVVAYL
jgi:hypothetical protein